MTKLEQLGCKRSVVGLVVPTGYSFNQDGSAIYQTIATLFIAQAMNIKLTWGEILTFLLVLKVTSKAAAGVSGSAFVALAATLASVQTVPVAGMALLLGVERFMSMARGTTNMMCNGSRRSWWRAGTGRSTSPRCAARSRASAVAEGSRRALESGVAHDGLSLPSKAPFRVCCL